MKYKRILLKISGEALSGQGGYGISIEPLESLSGEIKELHKTGVEVAIVLGGGNIHRGIESTSRTGMDRTSSDHMGMLATVINSIALQDVLEKAGVNTRVLTAVKMDRIAEPYIRRRALRHLVKKRVVIFAAGTGNPYFTTDTAAALRSNEIDADVLLKATKVDGLYDKDPLKHKDASRYDHINYIDVINKKIKVMDSTAITLCMDNNIDIIVFDAFKSGNIMKVVNGEKIGTIIN